MSFYEEAKENFPSNINNTLLICQLFEINDHVSQYFVTKSVAIFCQKNVRFCIGMQKVLTSFQQKNNLFGNAVDINFYKLTSIGPC